MRISRQVNSLYAYPPQSGEPARSACDSSAAKPQAAISKTEPAPARTTAPPESLNAQAALAKVNAKTTPDRVAELAWSAVTMSCKRPEFPTPSVFFAYTETEFRASDFGGGTAANRRAVIEYRVSGPASLNPSSLTEADRLNGFQWAGESKIPVTSRRVFVFATSNLRDEPPNTNSWHPLEQRWRVWQYPIARYATVE